MESIKHLFTFFLKIAFAIFIIVLVIWLTKAISNSTASKSSSTSTSTVTSTPKKDFLPSPRKYSGFFLANNGNSPTTAKPFVYTGKIAGSDISTANSNNNYSYNTYSNSRGQPIMDKTGSYVIGYTNPTSDTNVNNNQNSGRQPIYDSTGSYIIGYSDATIKNSPRTVTQEESNVARSQTIRNLSIYAGGHVYTGLSFFGEARSSMFRDGKFPIVVVDQTGRVVGVSLAVATTNWAVPGWVRFETKIMYSLPSNVPCTMIFEGALTAQERGTIQPLQVPIAVRCN